LDLASAASTQCKGEEEEEEEEEFFNHHGE